MSWRTRRFGAVDVILLVDNAEQPLQAAPLSAIRAALSSGHTTALVVAGNFYAIGFRLAGPEANLYDVEYKGQLKNGQETPPGMNGIVVSAVPGGLDIPWPKDYAICQLQLLCAAREVFESDINGWRTEPDIMFYAPERFLCSNSAEGCA